MNKNETKTRQTRQETKKNAPKKNEYNQKHDSEFWEQLIHQSAYYAEYGSIKHQFSSALYDGLYSSRSEEAEKEAERLFYSKVLPAFNSGSGYSPETEEEVAEAKNLYNLVYGAEADEAEANATYTVKWDDEELSVTLSELEHNVVKKTEELYSDSSSVSVEDIARVADIIIASAIAYEYWDDEWRYNIAKWCHVYLNLTTPVTRKELGVDVEISENCRQLTKEELAEFWQQNGMDMEADEDFRLKEELLKLAESGAPKPEPGTRLGDALIRFTTPQTPVDTPVDTAPLVFHKDDLQNLGHTSYGWEHSDGEQYLSICCSSENYFFTKLALRAILPMWGAMVIDEDEFEQELVDGSCDFVSEFHTTIPWEFYMDYFHGKEETEANA